MALSISTSMDQFRHDSQDLPVLTFTDRSNAWLKVADWEYYFVPADTIALWTLNRSHPNCPLVVRNLIDPTWVLDAGITDTGTGIQRTLGGSGFLGAYYATELDPDNCSIQAVAASEHACGISLQDTAEAVSHDYYGIGVIPHAMILGENGQGRIYEDGVLVPINPYFRFEVGDIGMIEHQGTVVRYFLIKPDYRMILLRTTRSKITANVRAEVMVFRSDAFLGDVFVHNNTEAQTEIELVGVLENFQDWQNDMVHTSTSEPIQMADNNIQFTFPNRKKQLRTLAASLAMRTHEERIAFLDFYQYHGMETAFIFEDNAHKDRDRNDTEFWAKFASPFSDKMRASCLSSHQAQIMEDYRDDYIPFIPDVSTPSAPVLSGEIVSGEAILTWGFVSGNLISYEFQLGVSGIGGTTWETWATVDRLINSINMSTFWGESYFYRVRAIHRNGNISAWSNIVGPLSE